MSPPLGWKKQALTVTAVALWASLVGSGMNILWRYSITPGQAAIPLTDWPAHAPVPLGKSQPTLVLFAHPNCPCSRATIGELAIIMARAQAKPDVHVLFYIPANEPSYWAKTDLWNSAAMIPGVHVLEDRDGVQAKLFGAFTSGQTFLYSSAGQLLFNGGITAARGHSGDNIGRDGIIALLKGESMARNATPAFGCSLRGL